MTGNAAPRPTAISEANDRRHLPSAVASPALPDSSGAAVAAATSASELRLGLQRRGGGLLHGQQHLREYLELAVQVSRVHLGDFAVARDGTEILRTGDIADGRYAQSVEGRTLAEERAARLQVEHRRAIEAALERILDDHRRLADRRDRPILEQLARRLVDQLGAADHVRPFVAAEMLDGEHADRLGDDIGMEFDEIPPG